MKGIPDTNHVRKRSRHSPSAGAVALVVLGQSGSGESVVNGGFDSSDDWELGTNWTIGSGVLTAGGTTDQVDQDGNLTVGKHYLLTYDLASIAGEIRFRLGNGNGESRTNPSDGTYQEVIQCQLVSTLVIDAVTSLTGNVDNVSAIELTADTDTGERQVIDHVVCSLTGGTPDAKLTVYSSILGFSNVEYEVSIADTGTFEFNFENSPIYGDMNTTIAVVLDPGDSSTTAKLEVHYR